MDQTKILKKVKENFKKKRRHFSMDYQEVDTFFEAYDVSHEMLDYLSNAFTEEEKEKYSFNRLKVGFTRQSNNKYLVKVHA